MDAKKQIERWFNQFEHKFDAAVPNIIAETATEFFKERIIKKNWDGTPWPKYNPLNKPNRKEPSKGSLLMRNNNLFASVRPSVVNANNVRISAGSSKVPYARVHNEGLRVMGSRYVRGFQNTNFMGTGRRVQIRPHTRKVDYLMPRRQFMGHSPILNKLLRNELITYFNK